MKTPAGELHCPPRYGTPRSPDRPTLGGNVAKVAAALGKPLLPHQRHIVNVAYEIDPKTGMLAYDEVDIIINRQQGKAIDRLTRVMTTRGWIRMADMRVGDYVYHPDGHPIRVTFVSDEMVGHDCYRATTTDGRSLVADAEHLWTVLDRRYGGVNKSWRTLTTRQIVSAGVEIPGSRQGHRDYRFRLPVQRAIKSPDVPLPIDPYMFGVWLGDGTSQNASLTAGDQDVAHVRAEIERAGYVIQSAVRNGRTGAWALWMTLPKSPLCSVDPCTRKVDARGMCLMHYKRVLKVGAQADHPTRPSIQVLLRDLGVLRNKHVPDAYLAAGHDQRLALLQGLLDSDGSISKAGQVEFTSTRKVLCDAVLFLVRSLGWRVTMTEGLAKLHGRVIGPRWRVRFTPARDGLIPFRLARKAERVREPRSRAGESHAVSLVSIEPVESRPVRCIKVDSPDGLFLAGRDLIATHNTELMLPIMAHRCIGFDGALSRWVKQQFGHDVPEPGPQRVLYTAQTASDATKKWRDIHVERLLKSPFKDQITVRKRLAMEAIQWPNGSSWSPGATTAKAGGTGDTLDLAVIDEAWSREDNRTELGMRPAMLTRPWRQLWVCSMIPGLARSLPGKWPYLHQKRQNGRARVQADIRKGTAYFEWSAPKGADPGDPATWWSCMPALGHTVPERAIRSDFEAMDLVDFCAEYLGWEPEVGGARWHVISEQTWRALEIVAGREQPYMDPVAFGVDAQPDLSAASIGMAALTSYGDTFVELIERRPGDTWLVPTLVDLADKHGPCAIGVAAHGPAAPIIEPLKRALLEANVDAQVLTFQGPDVAKACRQFYSETGEVGESADDRRIRHIGQPELDAAVAGAAKYVFSDEWRWQRAGEGGDASPLYAVTLARYAGEAVEWLGGSYNIASSLG